MTTRLLVEDGDGMHLDPRMHLDSRRLSEIVGDEVALARLADDAGLEPRVLCEAWRAERRLDRPALHRLVEALRLPVEELACPGREWEWEDTAPLCRACDAPNEIDDHLLNPAAERVAARQSCPHCDTARCRRRRRPGPRHPNCSPACRSSLLLPPPCSALAVI